MNLENFMRIMYEQKTRVPSQRNQDWRTVQAETEKMNEILTHILTKKITELNELIYAGAKLVCKKIGVPLKTRTETQNLDGKFDWKRR